jgi:hypothetical protein
VSISLGIVLLSSPSPGFIFILCALAFAIYEVLYGNVPGPREKRRIYIPGRSRREPEGKYEEKRRQPDDETLHGGDP